MNNENVFYNISVINYNTIDFTDNYNDIYNNYWLSNLSVSVITILQQWYNYNNAVVYLIVGG